MSDRRYPLRMLPLILAIAACSSCGDVVHPIGFELQAGRLPKSALDGVWYLRGTVVGVPPDATAAYVGQSSALEKVRWQIEERWLLAYRAYAALPTTGQHAAPAAVGDSPVAAFPIRSHFDIVRQPQAGTDPVEYAYVEDTRGRPWSERDWIRVDFAAPALSLPGLELTRDSGTQPAVGYAEAARVVDGEGKPVDFDALQPPFERAPEDWRGQLSYLDVVTHQLLQPPRQTYRESDGSETAVPLCPLARYVGGGTAVQCGPTEVELRLSLLRTVEADAAPYEPRSYDDAALAKFGFFRSERQSFNDRHGLTEAGRIQLANRHDLWEQSFRTDEEGAFERDADGQRIAIPLAERQPKPITYHLDPDTPCEAIATAREVVAGWNRVLRRAVAAAKGLLESTTGDVAADLKGIATEAVPEMVTLELNGWQQRTAGDDFSCENLELDPEQVEARLGDLRYHSIVWVAGPQLNAPLGHAAVSADPETGEIVSATALVYGAALDVLAGGALDIVRLLSGDAALAGDALTSGESIRDYVKSSVAPAEPSVPPDEGAAAAAMLDRARRARAAARARGTNGREARDRLRRLRSAGVDAQIVDDELARAAAPLVLGRDVAGAAELSAAEVEALSPLAWSTGAGQALERQRRQRASEANLWLADFADDAVAGLALEYWREHGNKGERHEALWQALRQLILRGVLDHELGHTFGLRHNFAGSYDSINYGNRYWELRSENLVRRDPTQYTGELTFGQLDDQSRRTEAQVQGRMAEHQYASVMDQGARFNAQVHGPGKYDAAALLFGYAGLVEVFDAPSAAARQVLRQRYSDCSPRHRNPPGPSLSPLLEQWHYSSIWNLLGEEKGLSRRRFASAATLQQEQRAADDTCRAQLARGGTAGQFAETDLDRALEVPYLFCDERYLDQSVACARGDQGADPAEIARDAAERYRAHYFFNNFRRQRLELDPLAVSQRIYERYFEPLARSFQQWMFQVAFYDVDDATQSNTWTRSTFESFNRLLRVVATPSYGTYGLTSRVGPLGLPQQVWSLQSFSTDGASTAQRLVIPPGPGRLWSSRYDYDGGYYGPGEVIEVGHLWEVRAALRALAPIGESSSAGPAEGSLDGVSFFVLHEDELVRFVDALLADDLSAFAPHEVDGQLVEPGQGGRPIEVPASYTLKHEALIRAMASFGDAYVSRMHVFLVGGDSPSPAAGWEVATCEDPFNGRVYGALVDPSLEPAKRTGAAKLITSCQEAVSAYLAGGPSSNPIAEYALNDRFEWLETIRRLCEAYAGRVVGE